MRAKILTFLAFHLLAHALSGQSYDFVRLDIANSYGSPDRRYDFLLAQYSPDIVAVAQSRVVDCNRAYSINLLYQKRRRKESRWALNCGLGYSFASTASPLPINNSYFGSASKVLGLNPGYKQHRMQAILGGEVALLQIGRFSAGMSFSAINSFSFRKEIKGFNFVWNGFEYSSIDVFPSVNLDYASMVGVELGYRVGSVKFRDEALANNGLALDYYNPLEIRLLCYFKIPFWKTEQ